MADESIVPPAAAEKMRKERQDRLDAAKAAKAYNKAIVYPESVRPDNKKAKGGVIKSSASRRGDGIAQRGKTRGGFV